MKITRAIQIQGSTLVLTLSDYRGEAVSQYAYNPDDPYRDRQVGALVAKLPAGFIEPPEPIVLEPVYTYSKKALFEAMTEDEYATFEQVEMQQSARDRRVFREAQVLDIRDPGFETVHELMKQVYGEERTAAILAAAAIL